MNFVRYHDGRITADEARALARRVRAGDAGARERLIVASAGIVHHRLMVARYRGLARWLPLEDAVQEGWVAIVHAVDGYDPDLAPQFRTFAFACVHHHLNKLLIRFRGTRGRMTPRPVVGLFGESGDGRSWAEYVADGSAGPWHAAEAAIDAAACLRRAVGREQVVIGLHYGLHGPREHNLGEIGAFMGVSRERALQLEKQAFRRMRA